MQCIAVNLDVPDIDQAVAYYRDRLDFVEGLRISDGAGRPRHATVWNGQATIMFERIDPVPPEQRHFATRTSLPLYAEQIGNLRARGARLVTVYGIGRVFHIAFWEPHFAAEFASVDEWRAQTHRLGAKLHPLTIEQNAITSFKSRTTLIPAFANTIGPALFLSSDRCIGGCDGVLGRGMSWQAMSLWVTLRYGPSPWVPSSWMPTLPGRLFFIRDLAGPLVAEAN